MRWCCRRNDYATHCCQEQGSPPQHCPPYTEGSRRWGPACHFEEIGDHDVLATEREVIGIRQLLDALDLLPVRLEDRREGEEAEINDARSQSGLFHKLRCAGLAQDGELHEVGDAILRQQPW